MIRNLIILIGCLFFDSKIVTMILQQFLKYYMPLADFNVLINHKTFSDQPLKNKQEMYKKRVEKSKSDNKGYRKLIRLLYHPTYYKVIGIHLLRESNTRIPQKFNIKRKLEVDNDTTMFVSLKNSKKLF